MSEFKGTPGPWSVEGSWVESDSRYIAEVHDFKEECEIFKPVHPESAANANLIAAAPELLEALQWALPLAKIAIDIHRMERIKCGHMDINGTYKNGETWVGIYQKEVDEIESAEAAIKKALGQ